LHLAPCTLHLAPCTLHLAPCPFTMGYCDFMLLPRWSYLSLAIAVLLLLLPTHPARSLVFQVAVAVVDQVSVVLPCPCVCHVLVCTISLCLPICTDPALVQVLKDLKAVFALAPQQLVYRIRKRAPMQPICDASEDGNLLRAVRMLVLMCCLCFRSLVLFRGEGPVSWKCGGGGVPPSSNPCAPLTFAYRLVQ
jgi:hypothetical protein